MHKILLSMNHSFNYKSLSESTQKSTAGLNKEISHATSAIKVHKCVQNIQKHSACYSPWIVESIQLQACDNICLWEVKW